VMTSLRVITQLLSVLSSFGSLFSSDSLSLLSFCSLSAKSTKKQLNIYKYIHTYTLNVEGRVGTTMPMFDMSNYQLY